MFRPLVAATLGAVSAAVVYAAVPLDVYRSDASSTSYSTGSARANPAAVTAGRQVSTGANVLSGRVLDDGGAPLAGAVVDAAQRDGVWRGLTVTDRRGGFTLTGVPAGVIAITIRRDTLQFERVVTMGAGATSVELRMGAGAAEQVGVAAGAVPSAAPLAQQVRSGEARAGAYYKSAESLIPRAALPEPTSMDTYGRVEASGFRMTSASPLSTVSVDVDTASYSNARRFLMEGRLPPADAVRVEEWMNYFPYAYPSPEGGDAFRVSTALTTCPWNPEHQLLRVGLRGRDVASDQAAPKNLVFLIDVSGSMMSSDKLPLVRTALRMLASQLTSRDRLALVVYAGRTELVLPSTPGDQQARIHQAIERLEAGGSTNGAGGIQLAYQAAREGFVKGGVNRVVLATDGDFNVGITSFGELTRLIETERQSGVFLSVLGVGRGNLKDSTLEALADRGNGNYAYVDSLQEARRVLVEQVGATLVTIAKDVKLQVEFNPRHVASYRLIGYENRVLQAEDFADDVKDAGEIGAGHTVTALYEIVPPGLETPGQAPLRYQQSTPKGSAGEVAAISVRHKTPEGARSVLQTHAVPARVAAADVDTRFVAAVAEAGLVLRGDPLAARASITAAVTRAETALGNDPGGWRAEFVRLMRLAASLQTLQPPPSSNQ